MNTNQMRLDALRRVMGGLTQAEFADRYDLNASYISQLLGGTRSFGERAARNMEDKIGLPSGTLSRPPLDAIEGEFSRIDGGNENVAPALHAPSRRIRDYPLISWVIAGEWAESPDNYQPGDGEELIPGNSKAGEKAYWLEIKNDSMTPYFPEGTRILVQPEGFDLVIGKYYVALLYQPGGKRETTFKQYTRDAGVEYLKPLNKEYRPIEVTDNVRIIGRVVDFDPPKGLL